MARLYSNENFPLPVVQELRRLAHDVLTSQEAGNAGKAIPDNEVLAFAKSQGRALITLNRKHFIQLHRASSQHRGIIVCTFDADFIAQANRIHQAMEREAPLEEKLIRVNRPALD